MTQRRRPHLWKAGALLGALAVTACGSSGGGGTTAEASGFPESPPAAEDQGPLKLLEWEGYQEDMFHPSFAEEFGDTELKYQYASAGSEFFSKIQTGGAQVDIAHPCANWIADYVRADLIAPIDVERLSNWDDVNKQQAELGKIDGKYYYVPWDWGYESLIVNTETVPGGKVPESWADMWDPAYEDEISMENFGEGAVRMAALALDLPYPDLSDEQLEQIKQKLVDLGPNIRTLWDSSSDLVQQMDGGDVSIGFGWNDQYARIKDGGTPVTYINPTEGRTGWSCGFVVMKDTEHYDLALEYIDSAISTEACVAAINEYFLGCSNETALEQADPKTVKALELDRADVIEATHFAEPLTPEQRTAFNQIWSEVTAGYGG
jgi:spermidine/putrescine transport system substrate-binding protein